MLARQGQYGENALDKLGDMLLSWLTAANRLAADKKRTPSNEGAKLGDDWPPRDGRRRQEEIWQNNKNR
jgi:hypothetical protein